MTCLVLVGTLAVAGCSGDDPQTTATTSAATPTDTPTQTGDARAVAEITALNEAYWGAVVESQNGPNPDPALFEGIAQTAIVEGLISSAQQLEGEGIHRTGEPTVGEPHITVDGTSARLEVCVDETSWGAVRGDEELPADTRGATPRVFEVLRDGEAWILTRNVAQQEATISC